MSVLQARTDGRNCQYQATGLWSTATMMVAVTIGEDDNVYFSKAPSNSRGLTGAWQTRQLGTGASAAVETNTLELPQKHDSHDCDSICVQESTGKVLIAGNMHNDTWQLIESVNPVNPNAPIANDTFFRPGGTNPPGVTVVFNTTTGYTYPNFGAFADGTLTMTLRAGATSRGDTHLWIRNPGANVWTYRAFLCHGLNMTVPYTAPPGGSGAVNDTVMSAYWNPAFIEGPADPHPDRMHLMFNWREAEQGDVNQGYQIHPSYMYSDDKGLTWKTITGQAVTLPVEPLTQTQVHLAPLANPASTDPYWPVGGRGLQQIHGLCIDGNGFPYGTSADANPAGGGTILINWDGTHWQWQRITRNRPPAGWFLAGRQVPVWFDGSIWLEGEFGNSNTGSQGPGRMAAIEVGGTRYVALGGNGFRDGMFNSATYGQETIAPGFEPSPDGSNPDPEARRRWGRLQWNLPQGTTPTVRALGGYQV